MVQSKGSKWYSTDVIKLKLCAVEEGPLPSQGLWKGEQGEQGTEKGTDHGSGEGQGREMGTDRGSSCKPGDDGSPEKLEESGKYAPGRGGLQ